MARIADQGTRTSPPVGTQWLRYRSNRAASRTHGWTGCGVSCSCPLLRQYVDRAASAVANQTWTDITDAGLDQVCFGWAGPVERAPATIARSSGPSLLIEYDNTQDGANHILGVARPAPRLRRGPPGPALRGHAPDRSAYGTAEFITPDQPASASRAE